MSETTVCTNQTELCYNTEVCNMEATEVIFGRFCSKNFDYLS